MKKATRKHTKAHNRKLILNIIYAQSDVSRADVARVTGLTRTTVSDVVAELIENGLIDEIGQGQSTGGKPPTLLAINEKARNIIGLDLASGEFRGAIIDLRGEIKHRVLLPIEDCSGEEAISLVYELIDKLLESADSPVLGIGIGSPGLMDAEQGIVRTSVNLEWKDLPLAQILQDRYQLPVYIANDSQVCALAENSFGENGNAKNLVLIKLGRGVGAGIVLNQLPYYGHGFGAGEIGHVKVDEDGELCGCGNYGCLETKISSRAIRKRAMWIARQYPESYLNEISANSEDITIEDIVEAFRLGDPYVAEIIQDVSIELAKALSFIVSVLNVERVVIAGSVSAFNQGLVEPIVDYLHASVLPAILQDTEVVTSSLGIDIVMQGAAAMVLQNELGIL